MIFFLAWIVVMALLTVGGAVFGALKQTPGPGYRTDRWAVGAASGSLVGFFAGLTLTFLGFLVAGMIIR